MMSGRMPYGLHISPVVLTHAPFAAASKADTTLGTGVACPHGDAALALPNRNPTRLTRKECRLVCSLINQNDREFLEMLLAHVRDDSAVARAVCKGILRYPHYLSRAGAERLMELLPHQKQPKYARNFALRLLETDRFAGAFEVVQKCAEVLSREVTVLSRSQRTKICNRAERYPDRSYVAARWVGSSGNEVRREFGRIDYAGAVSILLIARFPEGSIKKREVFKTAVRFAKQFPEAENLWLSPLQTHAEDRLRTWQTYLAGKIPKAEVINCGIRSSAAIVLPWATVKLVLSLIAPPRPAPIGFAVACACVVSLGGAVKIVYATLAAIDARRKRLAVYPVQEEQIFARRPAKPF